MGEGGDGVERELKFACDDLEAVRQRLAELHAERQAAATFEDNLVFDRNAELETEGSVLRLRSDRRGARLTVKGRARFEEGVKLRDEREISVSDAEEAQRLLEMLGYGVVQRYQKMREEWQLGSVVAALDHTPIGDFVEFEGSRAAQVAARCGFEVESAEQRSYLRIYADHLREHPEAPPQMVFP
jgi:predicted adenylyl cyclase CyaB